MMRLCLLVALCIAVPSLNATLVVFVPTRDGIVVGSDSRVTVQGKYFDIATNKVRIAPTAKSIAFAITGNAYIYEVPPKEISMRDWLQKNKPMFSGYGVVESYLASHPRFDLTNENVKRVGLAVAGALDKFLKLHPKQRNAFLGTEVCQLVLFEHTFGTQGYASVIIGMTPQGDLLLKPTTSAHAHSNDFALVTYFGESAYTQQNVTSPNARGYGNLSASSRALLKTLEGTRVDDVRASDVAVFVKDLIRAVEETMKIVPAESGVGGPVQLLFMTPSSIERAK